MGKQHQQAIKQHLDSDYDDDFESDLILPEGPLSLRLSAKDRAGQDKTQANERSMHSGQQHHQQQQRRPHTSNSDIESTISGSSSIIFSACSSDSATSHSESEDSQHRGASRSRARITTTTTSAGRLVNDREEEERDAFDDEEDDDEKSNTIKANQLPEDFAQQLALSKAQAALAKAKGPSTSTTGGAQATDKTRGQSSMQSTHVDWEEDLVFTSKESLNASRILHKKSSFSSHISESGSAHSRSTTSHSQSSSSNNKATSSSNEDVDEEDFFDDLEVPSYFVGKARHEEMHYNTPPSSVESKHSSSSARKADLQSLLNQKLKARVGLHEQFTNAASTSTSVHPESALQQNENINVKTQQQTLKNKSASPRHVEKQDERFEDSFVFDDLPSPLPSTTSKAANARAPARPSLPSSSSSRSLMNIPPSRSIERLSPLPSGHVLSSRSSSTRSNSTIRPSRSSLKLNEGPSSRAPTTDGSSTNKSSWGRAAGVNTISSGLRARPSLSNLSGIAASSSATPAAPIARPHTLARKTSHHALNESSRTHMSLHMQDRPSSSMAHYAQPTRASLARHHHLPFATITRSDSFSGSRPSTPLASLSQVLHSDSRATLTSSPSTGGNTGAFSRLARPTIASSAKSHKVTGSDPSGRTSASLGMPVTSNPSSPLKSMKLLLRSNSTASSSSARLSLYKQPRRTQTLGDGSELDGFDDLPVNREKEKRFVKIPMRRRQSSGVASVESLQSATTNATTTTMTNANARSAHVSQATTSRRERVDSAPEQMQSATKRTNTGIARASSRIGSKADASSNKLPSHLTVDDIKAAKSAKRPGLKLIRNLSASGLSRVQGQMRWNPVLLKWEGNESSLRDFDNVIASSARPALISPMGPLSPRHVYSKSPLANLPGSTNSSQQNTNSNSIEQKILSISNPHGTTPSLGGVRIVGDMIFDPVKRSWFSTSSEGEEEINFGDDEEDDFEDGSNNNSTRTRKIDAWEGGEQARLRTRRSFANDWSSNASSTGEDGESDWNVAEFSRKQMEAEKRHEEEMSAWKLVNGVQALQLQRAIDVRQFLNE